MSSEVPLSSALAVGAAQGGGGAPAAFSSAAMFLANPAGRCSGAGWCGSGACAFAAGLAGPQSAPNKYPRELCPPPLLPPRTIVSGCLSVFQKTTTLNLSDTIHPPNLPHNPHIQTKPKAITYHPSPQQHTSQCHTPLLNITFPCKPQLFTYDT
jgi:hypothetical protein